MWDSILIFFQNALIWFEEFGATFWNWFITNPEAVISNLVTVGTVFGVIRASIKGKRWTKAIQKIGEYMGRIDALNVKGATKKEITLEFAKKLFADLGIKYDESKVQAVMDNIIATSKRINAREKDIADKAKALAEAKIAAAEVVTANKVIVR